MGLFNWLTPKAKPTLAPFIEGGFFNIPDRDFFGWFSQSPDCAYTVTWLDAPDGSRSGGARGSGLARYYLLREGTIVAEGQLERPQDGKVADNGHFILNDWRFSDELNGRFYAFRADGTTIISQGFTANLYNNGLSADGRWAVCQMCHSPSDDSSVLVIFDLAAGHEIARWIPESGWATAYRFSEDGRTIHLCYDGGMSFEYRLDGTFTDRERWRRWRLAQGDLLLIEQLLNDAENPPSTVLLEQLIAATDVALAKTRPGESDNRARAYKLRGLCLEQQGDAAEALRFYQQALDLNPKIGVKRRADALRKAASA